MVDRRVGLEEVLVAAVAGACRVARPFALTIPIVTVWPMPSGLPTASTTSPTCTLSELPSGSVCRFVPSIFSTARSLGASVPTTFASNVRPSVSSTLTWSAPSTTWLLVRM